MEIYNQKMKLHQGQINRIWEIVIAVLIVFSVGYGAGTFFAKDSRTLECNPGEGLVCIEAWILDDARTPEDFNALLAEIENAIE